MKIDWDDVAKSVIVAVLSAVLLGGVAFYILLKVEISGVEKDLSDLKRRPFITVPGHVRGETTAEALVTIPEGENDVLLITANGYGASQSKQPRSSIVVRIEVDDNVVAREFVWVPLYVYDPTKFGSQSDIRSNLTPAQIEIQRTFPLVAAPIQRLERMGGPIEFAASASAIVSLNGGAHKIRGVCDGDDLTSKHVVLDYVDVRNAGR